MLGWCGGRCWQPLTSVCLRVTTCADGALPAPPPAGPAAPPMPLCQQRWEGDWHAGGPEHWALPSQDGTGPASPSPCPSSLAAPSPPRPPARVCSSHHPLCQPASQLCLSPGATLLRPSPLLCLLGPSVLSETWRFSNCACISPGAGEGERKPPTPPAFDPASNYRSNL